MPEMHNERVSRSRSSESREPKLNRELLPGAMEGGQARGRSKEKKKIPKSIEKLIAENEQGWANLFLNKDMVASDRLPKLSETDAQVQKDGLGKDFHTSIRKFLKSADVDPDEVGKAEEQYQKGISSKNPDIQRQALGEMLKLGRAAYIGSTSPDLVTSIETALSMFNDRNLYDKRDFVNQWTSINRAIAEVGSKRWKNASWSAAPVNFLRDYAKFRVKGVIDWLNQPVPETIPTTPTPAIPLVQPPEIPKENPNREKLKKGESLMQFMRESTIEIVRLAPTEKDLVPAAIIDKIKLTLGYDPKSMSQVDLFGELKLPAAEVEKIKSIVEGEIEVRCNLRLAQLKEEDFQGMKFGDGTTAYVQDLENGKFPTAQILNKTLTWLGETLPNIEDKFEPEKGHLLTRKALDSAFQTLHLMGAAVEHLRNLPREGRIDKDGKLTAKWKEEVFRFDKDNKVIGITDGGKKILGEPGLVLDSLDKAYLEVMLATLESGKAFYDTSSVEGREKVKELLKEKYGEDVESLAWQLFQGLRCEGLYFSGHYLGVLTLLDQSRNYLALNFDSWVGSKYDQIVVCRDGKLMDSEGRPFRVEDYGKVSFDKRNVVYCDDGSLVFRYDGDLKDRKRKPTDTEVTDNYVIPLTDAFKNDDEFGTQLTRVVVAPMTQFVKSGGVEDDHYRKWTLSGLFLEKAHTVPRGDKTIEGSVSSIIRYGYDFRDQFKKVRDIGAEADKAGQVGNAIKALYELKRVGLLLVAKNVFPKGIGELRTEMQRQIDNVLWELGVNNVNNTSGTQEVTKPQFLKPSGYNDLFERLALIPAGGSPLIETNNDLAKLRTRVEVLRKDSLEALKDLATTSDEDLKVVDSEDHQARFIALPEKLGGKRVDQISAVNKVLVTGVSRPVSRVMRPLGNALGAVFGKKPRKQ